VDAVKLIEVQGLRFRYGGVDSAGEALRGVDFILDAGETVILLGANGSGKTTFLLHLNGLLRGTAASLRVCGLELADNTLGEIRWKVGLVFQNADDQLFLPSVQEDVAFGLLNQGVHPYKASVDTLAMLAKLRLTALAERGPHHLSAGEKRRVALAGVLAMEPEILVLDEPTTSLDPPSRRELIALLTSLPQAKIISTHDAGFARAVGTRAVFFQDGLIVDSGGVDEVLARRDWL
jgi:cobalt/nickel transport system ATP-binding protein